MRVPLGSCHCRGVAVVLASGAAISLTALTGGMIPALAAPTTTTETTTVATAPGTAVVPQTTYQVPTQTEATVAPALTPEPTMQEPQVVKTTEAPQITTAPAQVTTTTAAPVTTQQAQVTTTTAAPVTTQQAQVTTTTAPTTASVVVATTTSAAVTTTAKVAVTTTASSAPSSTTAGLAPSTSASSSTSHTAATTAGGSGGTSPAATTSGAVSTSQPPVVPAGGQIEKPQTLQASPQGLEAAKASIPVEQKPDPAPQSTIDQIKATLNNPANPNAGGTASVAAGGTVDVAAKVWNKTVLQFGPENILYDPYYRPVIFNPTPDPLQVVYVYAGAPRIFLIPPLGSIVTEVPDLGSYGFTVLQLNAFGIPINVAVGNFFGGGYDPGPGLPPPPPPPPVVTDTDVPVVVKYTNAEYQPFRVQKLIDVGDDPVVGERKVLLDGATPAWGQWKQAENGERQFEVHKTQQFPGMDAPAEGPLPGDYRLLAAEKPTGLSTRDVVLIGGAAVVAVLGLGAIVLTTVFGRRRRVH
jgi:hypothetical protein